MVVLIWQTGGTSSSCQRQIPKATASANLGFQRLEELV